MNAASATTTAISQGLNWGVHTTAAGAGATSSCVVDEGNDSGAAVVSAMQFEGACYCPLLKSMLARPKPILKPVYVEVIQLGSRWAGAGSRRGNDCCPRRNGLGWAAMPSSEGLGSERSIALT
jgi:hypothetical protein